MIPFFKKTREGHPILTIDNFYSFQEEQHIVKELEYLRERLLPPEYTGSAKNKDNLALKKKNSSIFLDTVFTNRDFSSILQINRKLFDTEVVDMVEDYSIYFKYLRLSTQDSTLVSYYENEDRYASHSDSAVLTAISWFYKKPKLFGGGDLIIDDISIECKNRRLVLFPSILDHKVTTVTLDEPNINQGNGRYSISQFIGVPIQ